MNRGDAGCLLLNIKINGTPITQNYPDNIELTFSVANAKITKTLKNAEIVWNTEKSCFQTILTQADTFKMVAGNNPWQIRVLKDDNVVSSRVGAFNLGETISKDVL